MQSLLWEKIVTDYTCLQVVRWGDVDPESGVRKSGHQILRPIPQNDEELKDCHCNLGYALTSTGIDCLPRLDHGDGAWDMPILWPDARHVQPGKRHRNEEVRHLVRLDG